MCKTLAILLISFVTLIGAAKSQEAGEKKLAAARELAEAIGVTNQLTEGFDGMRPVIDAQADQLELEGDQRDEFFEIYKEWYENDFDHERLGEDIVKLYADEFTIEEMKAMTEFYRTPVGKKALEKFSELFQKGFELGVEEGKRAQPQLLERLQPFLEKVKGEAEE